MRSLSLFREPLVLYWTAPYTCSHHSFYAKVHFVQCFFIVFSTFVIARVFFWCIGIFYGLDCCNVEHISEALVLHGAI